MAVHSIARSRAPKIKTCVIGRCPSLELVKQNPDIFDLKGFWFATTLAGFMSGKVSVPYGFIHDLDKKTKKVVSFDFRKKFGENLKKLDPNLIVIDTLHDVKYNLLRFGEGYSAWYEEFNNQQVSKYVSEKADEIIGLTTRRYYDIWFDAASRLSSLLLKMPKTITIVVDWPVAEKSLDNWKDVKFVDVDFWKARSFYSRFLAIKLSNILPNAIYYRPDIDVFSSPMSEGGQSAFHYDSSLFRLISSEVRMIYSDRRMRKFNLPKNNGAVSREAGFSLEESWIPIDLYYRQ